ncbi:DoxX family protein [Sporosarcina sp. ANT_H38]|uniref:DoxX family protein n=1 Tax=Sporosarcina sp. ANT_H38 TaxID=2597358 RepID=UPI0011F1DDF8|nr:DoxX family protein [Sporosarcina sp. ANT_H38]KAA0965958.1 DoxX family protein [Sporosarcina sp. ANT_H38]
MTILTSIIQGLLAAMFLMAGVGKTIGSQMHKVNFDKWRLPQWFRVVTGLVELVGAILLIIGFWNSTSGITGALLLGVTAIGGILTHLRVKDSIKDTAAIIVLGILTFTLLFLLL